MVNKEKRKRIVIFGAGNVASHLAPALDKIADVAAIYSRHLENASALSSKLRRAKAYNDLSETPADADFYIISVKDDAIKEIVGSTPANGVWAHTSGSVPADVFKGKKDSYGVFYPLQTFNRSTDVDFSEVPMLIEGDTKMTEQKLTSLAEKISRNVGLADSVTRGRFHVAAVFACNFTNYLWSIADDILKGGGYDLSILDPLLKMTLRNAVKASPAKSQTGPAIRGDRDVIAKHLASLSAEDAEVYKLLTERIIDKYTNE